MDHRPVPLDLDVGLANWTHSIVPRADKPALGCIDSHRPDPTDVNLHRAAEPAARFPEPASEYTLGFDPAARIPAAEACTELGPARHAGNRVDSRRSPHSTGGAINDDGEDGDLIPAGQDFHSHVRSEPTDDFDFVHRGDRADCIHAHGPFP